MKSLFVGSVLILILQVGALAATLSATQTISNSDGIAQSTSSKRPIRVKVFAPKETGVFFDLAKRGPVIFSPLAPASEGMGEHFLTANPFPTSQTSKRSTFNGAPYGGINLFGWTF